jgi:hypothetical protein
MNDDETTQRELDQIQRREQQQRQSAADREAAAKSNDRPSDQMPPNPVRPGEA